MNNYPSCINVDLLKIIHKHDHFKFDYKEYKPKFDNDGKCIEFITIIHYKCNYCGKKSDYTEIENNYDLSCDEMNLLANQNKEYLECKKKGTRMSHPLTDIGICPNTGKIFRKNCDVEICVPGNIRPFCIMPDRYTHGDVCSECNDILYY